MVKSLSAILNSPWRSTRKQAVKWGGGVYRVCVCVCGFTYASVMLFVLIEQWYYFTFWSGDCLWGSAAPFEQQLFSQQSRHPQVGNWWHSPKNLDAWHGARHGKQMPPTLPLCRGNWMPLVDLLVCASVCCVNNVAQVFHWYQREALLVIVLLMLLFLMLIVRRRRSQWSKLVDKRWVTLCSGAMIPGRPASAALIGWLSSISLKHGDHRVKSGCSLPCDDVWVIFREKGVHVYAPWIQKFSAHTRHFNPLCFCTS